MAENGDGRSDSMYEKLFKAFAAIGALAIPLFLWLFSRVQDNTDNITALKKDVANIPQVIELSLMRSELKSANENLRKAIEAHQDAAPVKGH